MSTQAREFVAVPIAVMTASDSRTEADDKSGKLLVSRLQEAGHQLVEKVIVPDNVFQIRAVVSRWIADPDVQVILMTGGTGVTGFDGTPEAVKPLLEKELEGFGEIFRAVSFEEIGTSSLQSRAVAGVANGTYLFSLPGSSGACATAWDKLLVNQLDYRTHPCNLVELMPRLLEHRQ
ncbi:MAG TPA: molybdenum cofactor biosynthesis protein B [Gammaproteobacteria bacterium]|jgi:molybdenum cofactor biosynthesis protein B|nr:molybdenum cofactor biosynthesis protein B [Acidiferrobacteraceae bacterium]MDP6551626.1 molybdenum cofactor biosynthesis protein B [Arenicellales bacterium]MDP6790610.1 molybdenum cofactor biosynthesis protein B [Arenicellales bacterium]MDP6919212.1 molybdenum cofactor biosynthesis protein B [Arenicellales bacterium]HCX88879.1 molybdenum cofactor biosynthesis protein B [Gammaproteobacteria bacterium]|tara:strand:+ start:1046 stop:1576 length:531 start_codon:yes stop_codon:yes gene_type:complete